MTRVNDWSPPSHARRADKRYRRTNQSGLACQLEININPFVSSVKQLLEEAYEGTPTQSWFSDHGAGSGLFATLLSITAQNASRTLVSNGSSIAGHSHHLRWSLAMAGALMRGEQPSRDWSESWVVQGWTMRRGWRCNRRCVKSTTHCKLSWRPALTRITR